MRYAQGGGFTPQEQRRREEVRLQAAEMFAQGVTNAAVAQTLRVTQRSVERWRRAWREDGTAGLASAGPHALPRLSPAQFARLEAELERGPLAHGFADQYLLRRGGWSCQRPARRAIERDEAAIEVWKKEVWPQVEDPGHLSYTGSKLTGHHAERSVYP